VEFSDAYRQHFRRVTQYVRRRCQPDDVDDVVQETFLQAWAGWHRSPVEDPVGYFLWHAKYVILRMRRHAGRMCRTGETVDLEDVVIAQPAMQGVALYVEQLRAHFCDLGPAQHRVMEALHQGDTLTEIAQREGREPKAIATYAARARKTMRQRFGVDAGQFSPVG